MVEAFKASLPSPLAGLNRESVTSLRRALVQASRLPSQTSLVVETETTNQIPPIIKPPSPSAAGIHFSKAPPSPRQSNQLADPEGDN